MGPIREGGSLLRDENLLVIGETRTQVLADNLCHCCKRYTIAPPLNIVLSVKCYPIIRSKYCGFRAKESEGDTSWQDEEQASGPATLEDSYSGDVQGPINKEPWEKLHPDGKPESGIRKL